MIMSSLFSTPKAQPQVIETTPTVIGNSEQTQAMERARRKRRGSQSQVIAGNLSMTGNVLRKPTLGE